MKIFLVHITSRCLSNVLPLKYSEPSTGLTLKNGTHEKLWTFGDSNIWQKRFQNNSEHYNSACQSLSLTSFPEVKKRWRIKSESERRVKMSRRFLKVRIILCWRFNYVMRGWLTEKVKSIGVLFTNNTISNSQYFVRSVFLVHFGIRKKMQHRLWFSSPIICGRKVIGLLTEQLGQTWALGAYSLSIVDLHATKVTSGCWFWEHVTPPWAGEWHGKHHLKIKETNCLKLF